MLRHLREEAQPLAIDREVAGFLAAGRQPVAIKIERGRLQIVGVADDAQHRAASAGAPVVRLDTNRVLTEAIAMYRAEGYREIAPFNDNPYAHHWFEKLLDR